MHDSGRQAAGVLKTPCKDQPAGNLQPTFTESSRHRVVARAPMALSCAKHMSERHPAPSRVPNRSQARPIARTTREDWPSRDRVSEAQSGAGLKGKPIRALGCILFAAGSAIILGDQGQVYREHGFSELLQMTSPRNLHYYCAVAVVLMPGATLIGLGQWLVARRRRRRRRHSYSSDFMLRR